MNGRWVCIYRQGFICLVGIAFAALSAQAATRYVWIGGSNTSPFSDWASASKTITNAVAGAVSPDVILVTNGTYSGEATVTVPNGVTIRGFSGNPADVIVDGGNAYQCFAMVAKPNAVLDGLTLQRGTATYGGGVYVSGNGATIKNCILRYNSATYGGGIYADNGGTVSNSSFYGNTNTGASASAGGGGIMLGINGTLRDSVLFKNAGVAGGGVFTYGGTVRDCTIVSNTANGNASLGGGGVFLYNNVGTVVSNCDISWNNAGATTLGGGGAWVNGAGAVLANCTVNSNSAPGNGGGIYFTGLGIVQNCASIASNTANYGGGAYIAAAGGTISNCCIFRNRANNVGNHSGGGVSLYSTVLGTLQDCVISNNTCAGSGGGVCHYGGSKVIGCTITDNVSVMDGGGIYASVWAGQMAITRCSILRNSTTGSSSGGGLHIARTAATAGDYLIISNCVIRGNWLPGGGNGGGISKANVQLDYAVVGCLIVGNSTLSGYGGGFWSYGDARIQNCTIAKNYAGSNGGGLANYSGSGGAMTLTNCIVYTNTAPATAEIFNNATIGPGYSCSPATMFTEGVNGNTKKDPKFVDVGVGFGTNLTTAGDFRLQFSSPCVNTGTNLLWMAGTLDVDQMPRIDGGSGLVDMGCYEYVYSHGTVVTIR
jgi:predicted outer membrane repeat protein